MIVQAVNEQKGTKPNLSEIVRTLKSRDKRFGHLSHQRLSDWRDKTQPDRFVFLEKVLSNAQKGFLPGGDQTRFNIFVSFLSLIHQEVTNTGTA